MADFCYLHGRIPARAVSCATCEARRYNEADDDGEALPPVAPVQRVCEVCLSPIDYGSRCPRDQDDDLDPAERMFGGLAR